MKNQIYKIVFACLLVQAVFSGNLANANTVLINWTYLNTSPNCPIPVTKGMDCFAAVSGYLATDSFSCKVYFGDGTDTTIIRYDDTVGTVGFGIGHTYTTMGIYSVKYVVTALSDGVADSLVNYNYIQVGDSCGNITGTLYLDNNSNCVYDVGTDSVLRNYPVKILLNNNIIDWSTTDNNGMYHFTKPTGFTYIVEPIDINSSFQLNCPSSGNYSIVLTNTSSGNDFGVNCLNGFDIAGDMDGANFNPGHTDSWFDAFAYNFRCQPTSGTVKIVLDPLVSLVSSIYNINPPTSVNGDTLFWNYSNFASNYFYVNPGNSQPYQVWYDSHEFMTQVMMATSTSAVLGDSVCFTMIVDPITGDAVPANNTIRYCHEINTSWDPNWKQVSPKGIGVNNSIAPTQKLTYTIHFQNTGTDTAFNIGVYDTLDPNLDMNTFQVLNADHSFRVELLMGNVVKFIFNNILLPDSSTNPMLSQAQFTYSISPIANVANGVVIQNKAAIVFDYNMPVITNSTHNMIDNSLGIPHVANNSKNISIYPNPAVNELNVVFNNQNTNDVQLIDILGNVIAAYNQVKGNLVVNTTKIPSGIYTLEVNNSDSIQREKVIIIH